MRDPFLNTSLPFLANELAAKGGIDIFCTCPPDGPCFGTEDEPVTIVFIQALNDDEDDNGSGPADLPNDDDLDDDFDADEDGEEFEFELTEEGQAELERVENREEVASLGKTIDNMVYIVGMYTALVQNKVGA